MKNFIIIVLVAMCVFLLYYALPEDFIKKDIDKTEKVDKSKQRAEENVKADSIDDLAIKNSTHLKFKGVPIDGTKKEFVKRMTRKGMRYCGMQGDIVKLQSDFSGFKDCIIYVTTLDNKDLVSSIYVSFPKQDSWKGLYDDYKFLKDNLTKKYGKPASCVENFEYTYFPPKDDYDKMHAVGMNRCNYKTVFSTEKGDIILSIINDEYPYEKHVGLVYKDKENSKVIKDVIMDDL